MRRFFKRHSVGATMLAVAVFALVPSVVPLPKALQAFPELTSRPGHTLLVALWPKAAQTAPPTVAVLPDDPDKALVLPELDFSGGEKAKVPRGLSYEDEREGKRWELVIKKVQAVHVDVEEPCLDRTPQGECKRSALEPFFRALRAAREPSARAPVRVVVLGTSLIASDHITDVARRRMLARHGPGGAGYLYVDRPTRNAGRDVRCGKASPGWDIHKLTDEKWDRSLGLAGVAFHSGANEAQSVSWNVSGQRLAELFLGTQPGGGELEIKIDGKVEAELSTEAEAARPATAVVEIPEGSKRLEVKTRAGPVRLDGVSLETGLPGLVFDALGLPGGAAYVFLRASEDVFGAQLLQRRPALVVLMMGGNEAFDLSLNRYSIADAQKNFVTLIERVRRYAPQAAILIASPPDAGVWRMDKTINARKETAIVSQMLHEVARSQQVAIWDMQAAMGGEGSIERWWNGGLMNEDLVHPIGVGGDVFGYLFDMAIERARQRYEAKLMATRMQNRGAPPLARQWLAPHLLAVTSAPAEGSDAGRRGRDGGSRVREAGSASRQERHSSSDAEGDFLDEGLTRRSAARSDGAASAGGRSHADGGGAGREESAARHDVPSGGQDSAGPRERAGEGGGDGERGSGTGGREGAWRDGGTRQERSLRDGGRGDGGVRERVWRDGGFRDGGSRERPGRDGGGRDGGFRERHERDGEGRERLGRDGEVRDGGVHERSGPDDGGRERSLRDGGTRAVAVADSGTQGGDAGARDRDRRSGEPRDGGALEAEGTAEKDKGPRTADAGASDAGRAGPVKWPSGPGLSNPGGLTRFFERLRNLETTKSGRVAILQIGASHTAAQHFTDTARSVLADRFGYAGRGYVAAGKAYERLVRSGVERNLEGEWTLLDAMKVKTPGAKWGLTGSRAVAHPGATAWFDFDEPRSGDDDSARVQVFVLEEPGMGPLRVIVDDKLERTLQPPAPDILPRVHVVELGASRSKHSIRLENPGPGDVSVLGVSHELIRPGIIYDALGLPGSTAVTFSNYDSESLVAQLQARQPDLYVMFYGTNESALPAQSLEQVRAAYPKIIANLRIAAPDAACLFLGPTDRMTRKKKGSAWKETSSIDEVYDILREVASRNDCAFWETREAMGGEGSIDRWRKNKPPLANKDHVHLTHEGYRLLATEMVEDLLEAYEQWRSKAVAQGSKRP